MAQGNPLHGAEVAITGRLLSMTRSEAVRRLEHAGARYARDAGCNTTMLVAGQSISGQLTADGKVSKNFETFQAMKTQGCTIRLVSEAELLRMLDARDQIAELSRVYTEAQVSRIAEVPLSEVKAWVRRGLLQPVRRTNRLAWFEFKDIVQVRTLSRLTASGVAPAQIRRSLAEIARWLPEEEPLIGRLEAYERGLSVRLSDGSLSDPAGQRLMDFRAAGGPRVTEMARADATAAPRTGAGDWLAAAAAAEEHGDLPAAAGCYGKALETAPHPDTYFNLGNVLYEMGREAEAAEQYLQAIEAEHDFAEAWNNLGNALVALRKLEDGVRAYEMALSLEPDYPDPHCNLATVLERMGQSARAFPHRAACLRALPSEAHLRLLRQGDEED